LLEDNPEYSNAMPNNIIRLDKLFDRENFRSEVLPMGYFSMVFSKK
jgi:hypothetical protein